MPSHERDHFGINPTSPRCCDQDFRDNRLTVRRSVRSSRVPGRSAVSEDKFVDHVLPGRFASGFSNSLMAKDVRLYMDWRRDRRHLGTLRGRSAGGGLHGGLLVQDGPVSGSRTHEEVAKAKPPDRRRGFAATASAFVVWPRRQRPAARAADHFVWITPTADPTHRVR